VHRRAAETISVRWLLVKRPIHAIQRISAKRVYGFLQPFARGRQIALSVGVSNCFPAFVAAYMKLKRGFNSGRSMLQ